MLYIKQAGKLSRKERIFNFSKASFKLSSDELSSESDTVVAVLWYKTLHSFVTKSFYSDVQEKLRSEIISVNVRPEPKMPFKEPVLISWDKDEVVKKLIPLDFFLKMKWQFAFSKKESKMHSLVMKDKD